MIAWIFPFFVWFRSFNLATLRADGIAGLTVALALMPPVHGLCSVGRSAS